LLFIQLTIKRICNTRKYINPYRRSCIKKVQKCCNRPFNPSSQNICKIWLLGRPKTAVCITFMWRGAISWPSRRMEATKVQAASSMVQRESVRPVLRLRWRRQIPYTASYYAVFVSF